MADTVSVRTARSSTNRGEYVYRLTNKSDGTGESAVQKIDVSSFTTSNGSAASKITIDRIEWNIGTFSYVELLWDHTTDITAAVLSGSGVADFSYFGGYHQSDTGGTGDLLLTTVGAAADASYDITIYFTVG